MLEPKTPSEDKGDTASDAPDTAAPPLCNDSACFLCGDGLCPVGFVCERPRAGASYACASFARCATHPSCACLQPFAQGCDCTEKDGQPYLDCK